MNEVICYFFHASAGHGGRSGVKKHVIKCYKMSLKAHLEMTGWSVKHDGRDVLNAKCICKIEYA